jgi:O-antigen/teichoic acid export membrane protein
MFWFIAARIAGADAIGLASSIASFTMIIAVIDVLDTHIGMKRYLGIAASSGEMANFKQILMTTVIFVSVAVTISDILIATPNLQILEIVNIERQYQWLVLALIPTIPFHYVFSEGVISALRSKALLGPLLLGSVTRFPLIIAGVYLFNAPTMAAVAAYSSSLFVSTICYSLYLFKFLKSSSPVIASIRVNIKRILRAALAGWIPHIISVLGSQLSIITVFAVAGSTQAGIFYIPQTIFTLTLFIVSGINRVSHPLVASMTSSERQTGFLSYSMKIAFMFTMPMATPLLFFPGYFLGLMGEQFTSAASTMSIFIINIPIAIISEMVFYFVYGIGDNKSVLYLGLAGNVPRIISYFILIPLFSYGGAALAYSIGSIAQGILSAKVAKRHSLVIEYSKCIILTAIPLIIGSITYLFEIQALMSTLVIFLVSLVVYIKLRLFTETELRTIVYSGLPDNTAKKIYPMFSRIMERIR